MRTRTRRCKSIHKTLKNKKYRKGKQYSRKMGGVLPSERSAFDTYTGPNQSTTRVPPSDPIPNVNGNNFIPIDPAPPSIGKLVAELSEAQLQRLKKEIDEMLAAARK
jgi:hypothetical protein